MTTIAPNSFKFLPQIATKIAVFNAQIGRNISAKTVLIAGAKIAPNLVFTSISNTRKSLEQAVVNFKLKSFRPDESYVKTYSTLSGKTKLLVTDFFDPSSEGKHPNEFRSYNFPGGLKVNFYEPLGGKKNKEPMRAYIDAGNKEFELPTNSYIDFSKGISMDKALIISNVIDINGKKIRIAKTVLKAFEEVGFVPSKPLSKPSCKFPTPLGCAWK